MTSSFQILLKREATGKACQVVKEMRRLKLAILDWGRKGPFDNWRNGTNSGLAGDDAPHEKGVTLILSKAAGKSLKEWEPISERIISARF